MFRNRFSRAILGMLLSIFVMSCGERPTGSQVSGTVRVRIPWKTDAGGVSVQDVELKGIKNLQEMKGAFAHFYFAPKISEDSLQGPTPRAQFSISRSGVYLPLDELSQQMAVLYAHMQALHGMDQGARVEKLLTWPRKISVGTRIRERNGRLWENNVFYDGGTDAILVVPYTDRKWPLIVNPGVIGHEHFHALFYRSVVLPLLKEGLVATSLDQAVEKPHVRSPRRDHLSVTIKAYNTVFMKMLNEGLADVWGWIYSGQPDFIGKSISRKSSDRSLKNEGRLWELTPEDRISSIAEQCRSCLGSNLMYEAGSTMARAVRTIFIGELSEASEKGKRVRERLAARLMKALPMIAEEFRRSSGDSKMNFGKALAAILRAEPLSEEEQTLASFWLKDQELASDREEGGFQ